DLARRLGLHLPYARQATISGAAGTQTATLSFPPDGLVSLFVTDYQEYCYLQAPLVGFHSPSVPMGSQRCVLGRTGFLRHFRLVRAWDADPPFFELHPRRLFPGLTGLLPRDRPLADFVRSLRNSTTP